MYTDDNHQLNNSKLIVYLYHALALLSLSAYTLCLKKCTDFEMV